VRHPHVLARGGDRDVRDEEQEREVQTNRDPPDPEDGPTSFEHRRPPQELRSLAERSKAHPWRLFVRAPGMLRGRTSSSSSLTSATSSWLSSSMKGPRSSSGVTTSCASSPCSSPEVADARNSSASSSARTSGALAGPPS